MPPLHDSTFPGAHRRFPLAVLAVLAISFCVPSSLAGDEPGRLDLETERVVVFKDGHGLFVKEARGIADDRGKVYTEEVPDSAILGTFWAMTGDDLDLLSMTAGWVKTVEQESYETACTSLRELLRVNRGKKVSLRLKDGPRIEGELVELLERSPGSSDESERRPAPAARGALRSGTLQFLDSGTGARSLPELSEREIVPEGGDFVVIDSENWKTTVVVPVSDVELVTGADLMTRMTRERGESKAVTYACGFYIR